MKKYQDGKLIDMIGDETTEMSKEFKINALKDELSNYDYIGVKIAMGVATKEEYAEQIAYTEQLRREINELESMI